jgi:hypothetical protein
LRWFALGALLAALGISGGSIYVEHNRQQAKRDAEARAQLEKEKAERLAKNAELAAQRRQLEEVVQRLNVERRVAIIDVLQQHSDPVGKVLQTVIRFTELNRDGEPIAPQVFGVAGEMPHFDALVIKFEKDFVAQGDALRGHSLALFRRVYGDSQAPDSGYWLGKRGDVPDIYRVNPTPSEFERRLWMSFWDYATDPEKARGAGVRVAQGEAVYAPMRPGEQWTLTLDADGGLNLMKQDPASLANPVVAMPAHPPTGDPPRQNLSAPSPLKDDGT